MNDLGATLAKMAEVQGQILDLFTELSDHVTDAKQDAIRARVENAVLKNILAALLARVADETSSPDMLDFVLHRSESEAERHSEYDVEVDVFGTTVSDVRRMAEELLPR